MAQLGIAVVTYRRRELLERLVARLIELTSSPHELVIADDGSNDGTAEWARAQGLALVTGRNRGVAWNKNRAIFALASRGCDPLVLLEDDVAPIVHGWEQDWVHGTRVWHHLAYQHPVVAPHAVSGSGTPADPFVNPAASGVCLSVSAEVLAQVGFLDSRFKGYGHEHAEWTTRIKRAGYGFRSITLPDGRRPKAQLYLTGGLAVEPSVSHRDLEQARLNRELQVRIAREHVFRRPWRSAHERSVFLDEQARAGFDGEALAQELDERIAG
ncbi:MAG TPA: glycosyltransferase [Solirubrobacteraceae bacterium]|nr:glycosyltransferase [Solirubrobacteraceae bacterium]